MNRALPEMLHCLNTPANLAGGCTDMSVLDRQRARVKWQQEQIHNQHLQQQQQQQQRYFGGNEFAAVFSMANQAQQQFQGLMNCEMGLDELMNRPVKADPGVDSGWPEFGQFGGESQGLGPGGYGGLGSGSGYELNYGLSRTISCPPAVAADTAVVVDTPPPEKMSSNVGNESFKKRKADKNQNLKAIAEEESKEKRNKACAEEGESKITEQHSNKDSGKKSNKGETSGSSKENSKVSDKTDYIHVRARRGQATDSHSLAERVRREKISERMKYLQDLVPGCNKITGKAGMLDEIINYVQSLQRQVEFLSMKLATVNPTLDFNIENLFAKETFPACTPNFPVGGSSEVANPAYLQFNQLQQVVSSNGLEMGIDSAEMALRRTISAPVPNPETFLDLSCFNQIQSWDANLQSLYGVEFHQGRSPSFPAQQFSGSNDGSNLKMEM